MVRWGARLALAGRRHACNSDLLRKLLVCASLPHASGATASDTGRVIPWSHFKEQIFDIYKDYIQNQWEIRGGLQTAYTTMDEYLCLYFLKTHKLRRTCELKLFEFLVSLRYYIKSQSRATMFALLCNITSFPSSSANENSFVYNFDVYVQNYFFYVFQFLVNNWQMVITQDTSQYITKQNAIDLSEAILQYSTESVKHKL